MKNITDEVSIPAWGHPLQLLSASLNITPVHNMQRHLTVFCKLIVTHKHISLQMCHIQPQSINCSH
jgi:hypothetical protein